jgi:chromosomal replication initiation ATPase DnaA
MLLSAYTDSSIFMSLFKILTFLDQLSLEQRGYRMEALEREILNTVWENKPYRDIVSFQEQTVKNKAQKLWKYLSQLLNTRIGKGNVRQVLEQLNTDDILAVKSNSTAESLVCGRSVEIFQLQQWIEVQKSKLIFIDGMRGIGKTYIANKIAELLSPNLDYLVWISLTNPVPLIDILPIIIKRIGGEGNKDI